MKELKFNEQMQSAIDEGCKTQTRRAVEDLVIDEDSGYVFFKDKIVDIHNWKRLITKYCPFGKIGDVNNGYLITDIRVERLQDISEEDAIAEGIIDSRPFGFRYDGLNQFKTAIDAFEGLWESIYPNHPTKGWSLNPYVWVITFESIEL